MQQNMDIEESLVKLCVMLQMELHEPDADVILDMTSFRFDMLIDEMVRRSKPASPDASKTVNTFG